MANMIVAGAGTSIVNGTYVEDGIYNDKPIYKNGIYSIMWNYDLLGIGEILGWHIQKSTTASYYYCTDDVATPDLCTVWGIDDDGDFPVPTVTLEGGGDGATTEPNYYYAQQ